MSKIYGIDVSHHQGAINWATVAAEPRRVNGGTNPGFAILRAGYSARHGKGGLYMDSHLLRNIKGCEQYGVPMGIYVYCYDQSADAAAVTAEQTIRAISGHKFDYPIYYDVEYEPFNKTCGKAVNTAIIKSALEVWEKAGYYAAVYCSRDFFVNYTNLSVLTGFDKWEAAYTATDTNAVQNGLWQYSSRNALGIKGFGASLDCDVSYVDYPAIMRAKSLNGYPKPSTDTKPAGNTTPLQCPTIGPMSKGDFDAILAAANGSTPTAYTVTFPPMTTAAASVLQQKAHGLSVGYSSAWAEG